ncbi:unnamed protein product [Peronospora destructor]|uniref:TLC domain-containing protein n=1 Tax=Peronospora destructor TaxID=86335 RepID=A0AAV0UNV8_9STRA|nr:unnamed protein product [Peronospora destructor]
MVLCCVIAAKVFVYLKWETVAKSSLVSLHSCISSCAGSFIRTTFCTVPVRLHTAILSCRSTEAGSFAGIEASVWYWTWIIWFGFLCLLLVLHIYWGILIVKMVIKALGESNIEKDIRSGSEGEEEEEKPKKLFETSETTNRRHRRAPRAE